MVDHRAVVAAQQQVARERKADRSMRSVLVALRAFAEVVDQAERDAAEARIPRSEFHVFLGDAISTALRPFATRSGRLGSLQLVGERTQADSPPKLRARLEEEAPHA